MFLVYFTLELQFSMYATLRVYDHDDDNAILRIHLHICDNKNVSIFHHNDYNLLWLIHFNELWVGVTRKDVF